MLTVYHGANRGSFTANCGTQFATISKLSLLPWKGTLWYPNDPDFLGIIVGDVWNRHWSTVCLKSTVTSFNNNVLLKGPVYQINFGNTNNCNPKATHYCFLVFLDNPDSIMVFLIITVIMHYRVVNGIPMISSKILMSCLCHMIC